MTNIHYSTVPSSNGLDKNAETLTRLPKGQFNTTAKKICTYRGPEFCPKQVEHLGKRGVPNPEWNPMAIVHPLTWITEEAISTGLFFRKDGGKITKLAFENRFRNIIESYGCIRNAESKKNRVYTITLEEFSDALIKIALDYQNPPRGNPQIMLHSEEDALEVFNRLSYRWGKYPSLWGETFVPEEQSSLPFKKPEPKCEVIPKEQPRPSLWGWLTKLLYNLVTPFITAWNGIKDLFLKATGGLTNA
jgi:hypothetical protein